MIRTKSTFANRKDKKKVFAIKMRPVISKMLRDQYARSLADDLRIYRETNKPIWIN